MQHSQSLYNVHFTLLTATGYRAGRFSAGAGRSVQTGLGPTQYAPEALSQRIKRPGRDADHSFPSNAEVRNGGVKPPLHFMYMISLVMHKLLRTIIKLFCFQ